MSHDGSAPASSRPPAATLSEYLGHWAAARPRATALRHKSYGAWVAWTWGDLQAQVGRVAVTLEARGFEPGDVVVIAAALSPPALVVALAAHGLGGAAIWIDPEDAGEPAGESSEAETRTVLPAARFGFAGDEAALAELRTRLGLAGPWVLGIFAAERGSPQDAPASPVLAYADAVADHGKPGEVATWLAQPHDIASYVRPPLQSLSHGALITAARAWLDANDVKTGHEVFAWEAPTTAAAATLLAGWLVAGISLILPEEVATADVDRREVQPTIVAATAAAYEKLRQKVADSLPARGSLLRAVVNAGLASARAARGRRLFGQWLVRRPLRTVLGFQRVEVALLLGASPPPAAVHELFVQLGVPLRALRSLGSSAETSAPAPRVSAPPADESTLFEPAPTLALAPSSASVAAGKLA